METEKNFNEEKRLKFTQFYNFKRALRVILKVCTLGEGTVRQAKSALARMGGQ